MKSMEELQNVHSGLFPGRRVKQYWQYYQRKTYYFAYVTDGKGMPQQGQSFVVCSFNTDNNQKHTMQKKKPSHLVSFWKSNIRYILYILPMLHRQSESLTQGFSIMEMEYKCNILKLMANNKMLYFCPWGHIYYTCHLSLHFPDAHGNDKYTIQRDYISTGYTWQMRHTPLLISFTSVARMSFDNNTKKYYNISLHQYHTSSLDLYLRSFTKDEKQPSTCSDHGWPLLEVDNSNMYC